MEGWHTLPLGDALTFQRGFDITKSEQHDGPYPVISSSGIKSTHAEYKVRGPGVIIGRKGSLGTVFYSETDYWPHDTTLWVKDFHRNNPRFAYYFLQTMAFERLDAGASNPSLNRNHIHTILVRWPSLPIQRRIAGILSAYDELIENCQRRIRILEEMARALYREWFVHFRFPGHERVPLVDSPLGPIPDGWEGRFGDLATISRKSINPFDFSEENFEHFSIPAFDEGKQPAIELGETIRSGKYLVDDTSVLLSKLNPRISRVWLPQPSGCWRAITSTEFLVLKQKPKATREFIYAKCCSDEFAGQFVSLAIGTSTSHQRVKPGDLLAMPCTVPDDVLMRRFSVNVTPMLKMSQLLRNKIQNLRGTRDLLLPRLLSGHVQLHVENAPEAEAALSDLEEIVEDGERSPRPSQRAVFRGKSEVAKLPLNRSTATSTDLPTPPPIDEIGLGDVLQIIRHLFSARPPRQRDDAIREIAHALGYHRTGARIRKTLDDLRTAVRRGILENTGGELRLCANSITEYNPDFLEQQLQQYLAAYGSAWIDRDTVTRGFARWLGFARTGRVIEDTVQSLINTLVLEGRLEADGAEMIRRR